MPSCDRTLGRIQPDSRRVAKVSALPAGTGAAQIAICSHLRFNINNHDDNVMRQALGTAANLEANEKLTALYRSFPALENTSSISADHRETFRHARVNSLNSSGIKSLLPRT